MTARHIGEKAFTGEAQQLFASVSHDRNPMHMDAIAARRLVTGHQVVHGIHVLITAIEYWQKEDDCRLDSISCTFNSAVSIDDNVVFTQNRGEENEYRIEASVDGLLCSQIIVTTAKSPAQGSPAPNVAARGAGLESRVPVNLDCPLDEKPEFHLNKNYIVEFSDVDFSVNFPRCYLHLGKSRFAAIAALSRFVGMICPGLHSIFSSLSLELGHDSAADDVLTFRVRTYDHRSRLFDIAFHGCIGGNIRAFLRPPPQVQPSLADLSATVMQEEFRGTRSLIIGGSRGLGEITAKVLAAGGGDVVITYASGLDDAVKIRDEINDGGRSTCEVLKVDLTKDSFDTLNIDFSSLNAVYFFATPRIFRKKALAFEPRIFHEFCDMYIRKFYDLCAYLEGGAAAGTIKVFFPSSVSVSERPKGLAEYAMAKAAAEVLIEEINRSFKHLSILSARLPRLSTDQTATVLKVPTESNLETLLPIIRSVTKAGTETRRKQKSNWKKEK